MSNDVTKDLQTWMEAWDYASKLTEDQLKEIWTKQKLTYEVHVKAYLLKTHENSVPNVQAISEILANFFRKYPIIPFRSADPLQTAFFDTKHQRIYVNLTFLRFLTLKALEYLEKKGVLSEAEAKSFVYVTHALVLFHEVMHGVFMHHVTGPLHVSSAAEKVKHVPYQHLCGIANACMDFFINVGLLQVVFPDSFEMLRQNELICGSSEHLFEVINSLLPLSEPVRQKLKDFLCGSQDELLDKQWHEVFWGIVNVVKNLPKESLEKAGPVLHVLAGRSFDAKSNANGESTNAKGESKGEKSPPSQKEDSSLGDTSSQKGAFSQPQDSSQSNTSRQEPVKGKDNEPVKSKDNEGALPRQSEEPQQKSASFQSGTSSQNESSSQGELQGKEAQKGEEKKKVRSQVISTVHGDFQVDLEEWVDVYLKECGRDEEKEEEKGAENAKDHSTTHASGKSLKEFLGDFGLNRESSDGSFIELNRFLNELKRAGWGRGWAYRTGLQEKPVDRESLYQVLELRLCDVLFDEGGYKKQYYESSWGRLNRRLDDLLPGHVYRDPKLNVHAFVDVSGSVTNEELSVFLSALKEFLEQNKTIIDSVRIYPFDDGLAGEVINVKRLEKEDLFLKASKVKGGGGTVLSKAFKDVLIKQNSPDLDVQVKYAIRPADLVCVLTDTYFADDPKELSSYVKRFASVTKKPVVVFSTTDAISNEMRKLLREVDDGVLRLYAFNLVRGEVTLYEYGQKKNDRKVYVAP